MDKRTDKPQIVASAGEVGVYYVEGQTWQVGVIHSQVTCPNRARARLISPVLQVGSRYKLIKSLGSGSFSSVVLAYDNETQEEVGKACRDRHACF
jgi:hypothetical protein